MVHKVVSILDQDTPASSNLKSRLEHIGFNVLPVTRSIDAAIRQISQQQPQVVFFNIPQGAVEKSLNIISGLGVLDVPTVLVVDERDKIFLDTQTQAFQFDWISKPIIDAELQAIVKLALYRQKANKKILDQQQQIKAIAHSTGEGFITFDTKHKIGFMNMIAEMMTGWDQEQAFGKGISEVVTLLDQNSQSRIDIADLVKKRDETGPLTEFRITLLSRDGNRIPVRAKISPIRDLNGTMYGGVLSFGNISELEQAIHEARMQNQRTEALLGITAKMNSNLDLENVLQALLEETSRILETEGAFVILFDDDRKTYQVVATYSINKTLQKYKGKKYLIGDLEVADLATDELSVRVFSDKHDHTIQLYSELLKDENISTLALAPLQSENELLGVILIFNLMKSRTFSDGELLFLKGLADQASLTITNARLFENINHSRFRLQVLSKRLVDVQEAERRSLARELHDQIGQMLTGLQFTLESGKRSASETKHIFEEAQEIIHGLIQQVRDLSLRLLPSMLEDMGLLPTLQWHFEQYTKQTGIHVNFLQTGLEGTRFPHSAELAAYRIIQEGLTNVARYAQVDQVNVNVDFDDSTIRAIISDQGIGFDPEETVATRHSFGLFGMRERLLLLGGNLIVNAAPGKGTKLKAYIPLVDHVERRAHAR